MKFNITLWAEIDGERIEVDKTIDIPIPDSHCPLLARDTKARLVAEAIANKSIKTGWDWK
jgi:hypothetical protein